MVSVYLIKSCLLWDDEYVMRLLLIYCRHFYSWVYRDYGLWAVMYCETWFACWIAMCTKDYFVNIDVTIIKQVVEIFLKSSIEIINF